MGTGGGLCRRIAMYQPKWRVTFICGAPHLNLRSSRYTPLSSLIQTRASHTAPDPRLELLKKIYAPFARLEKGSPGYNALAESGKCWSDYFNPGNMNPYKVLQNEYSDLLHKIDSYRSSINRQKAATFIKSLIPEYAHQSVQIENNRLLLSEALHIAKLLDPYLQTLNLSSLPSSNLPSLPLPPAHELLPSQPPSQVSELRNHLIASHWVTTQALQSPQINPLLSEPQTRHLTALLTRDTPSEHLHSTSWGGRTTPGSYRKTPIRTRSNPLCIFPYHTEVPNLMHQFFTWRDTANADLHPLLLACQMVVYFTSIHPFLDGNGPVRRVLMQDNLMRRGYFPVVMRGLGDGEYGGLLSDCQDGDGRGVEGFVGRVLWGELDAMRDCALLGRG